jgi:glyoxylase-like metal-dependent hydrolase (beta-lactamase superfamily II)
MTLWICATCGIEQADTPQPPDSCPICLDERQYLREAGQIWTTMEELQEGRTWSLSEREPGLYALTTSPSVGIGQRGILIQTEEGNLLWEPPGFYNEEMFEAIVKLGGVAAITSSHPHLTGASVSMSHRFGDVPVYWNRDDQRWIRRPDDVIQLWQDKQEVLPGVTLYQCGGHFAGSSVLHWPAGAGGRGILLTGDTMMVGSDRATVTFLRSYPNRIPLPERTIRRIAGTVAPLAFDRLYSGFEPGLIASNAREAVQYSANRYIGWINDELRDPDDRFA